jgi:hypothetical protein
MATESILGVPEVRPTLLDDVSHTARCRRARNATTGSQGPSCGDAAGSGYSPTRRSQACRGRITASAVFMNNLLALPADDDDEVVDDEDFDDDAELDEDADEEDDDDEEEETWQVFAPSCSRLTS